MQSDTALPERIYNPITGGGRLLLDIRGEFSCTLFVNSPQQHIGTFVGEFSWTLFNSNVISSLTQT